MAGPGRWGDCARRAQLDPRLNRQRRPRPRQPATSTACSPCSGAGRASGLPRSEYGDRADTSGTAASRLACAPAPGGAPPRHLLFLFSSHCPHAHHARLAPPSLTSLPLSPCRPPSRHGSGVPLRCSNSRRSKAVLHRSGTHPPSTAWGLVSCPDRIHSRGGFSMVIPGQLDVDLWQTVIHRLWIQGRSLGRGQRCPHPAHRLGLVAHSFSTRLSTVRQRNARAH